MGDATAGSSRGEPVSDRSKLRRFLEVTGFWLVYIGLGEALDLGPSAGEIETYLLLGVPLVVIFQLFVARRDIRELWVRTAPAIVFRRLTIAIAIAAAIYPVISVVKAIADSEPASVAIAYVVITAGAGAAGYAFGLFRRGTWPYLLLCILFGAGYGVLATVVFDGEKTLTAPLVHNPEGDIDMFLKSFLGYIPTVFVFEEVVFRGALDSHLHRPGERRGILTATYISLLWCLWHAPLFGWDEFLNLIIAMLPMGIAFSVYWRKSGNLGVSGTAHALSDSIRNASVGVP